MSALTDLFTSMANKIRSKTGTQTTYTPAEMASDGIDDVYAAGAASVPSPTSITPSNVSPVALTANTAVKPTANGYAIASYDSKTPSDSTPPTVASGDIVKMGGAGYLYATEFPDFAGAPDVNWYNMSAGTSGTASITVTQKPRYIICALTTRASTYNFRTIFIDVENNKGWTMGCRGGGSGTPVNEDFTSQIGELFPTISATTVVYNYVWWGGNHRVEIGIYY